MSDLENIMNYDDPIVKVIILSDKEKWSGIAVLAISLVFGTARTIFGF